MHDLLGYIGPSVFTDTVVYLEFLIARAYVIRVLSAELVIFILLGVATIEVVDPSNGDRGHVVNIRLGYLIIYSVDIEKLMLLLH